MRLIIPRRFAAAIPTMATVRSYRPHGGKLGLALFALWAVGGILTLTIPRAKQSNQADKYYTYYGRYVEYQNQQRQYEQQQNQGDDDNENDGYNYVPDCKWYQWNCRKQMYNYFQNNGEDNDNDDNNAVIIPTWYKFVGGKSAGGDEMRRWQEENGMISADETPTAVAFVNGYTMLLFVALLLYGSFVFITGRAFGGLIMAMAFFSQFLLLILLLLPQGVIETDDRELENSIYGWHGQTAVLMVYQDFACIIFCLSFIGVLLAVKLALWYKGRNEMADGQSILKSGEYSEFNDSDKNSYNNNKSTGDYCKATDVDAQTSHRELV